MITLDLNKFIIEKGGSAYVLLDRTSKRAFKLFKSYDHPSFDGTGKEEIGSVKTNEFYTEIFNTQRDAYELAQRSTLLKMHTPQYFGTLEIASIIENGQDVKAYFLPSCCLQLEYIEGACEKVEYLRSMGLIIDKEKKLNFKLAEILEEFQSVGINYFFDASAIYNDQQFKIIDFSTKDPTLFEPILGM